MRTKSHDDRSIQRSAHDRRDKFFFFTSFLRLRGLRRAFSGPGGDVFRLRLLTVLDSVYFVPPYPRPGRELTFVPCRLACNRARPFRSRLSNHHVLSGGSIVNSARCPFFMTLPKAWMELEASGFRHGCSFSSKGAHSVLQLNLDLGLLVLREPRHRNHKVPMYESYEP